MTLHFLDIEMQHGGRWGSTVNMEPIFLKCLHLFPHFISMHNCSDKMFNVMQKKFSYITELHNARTGEPTKRRLLYYCREPEYDCSLKGEFSDIVKHKTVIATKWATKHGVISSVESQYVKFTEQATTLFAAKKCGYLKQSVDFLYRESYEFVSKRFRSNLYSVQFTPGKPWKALRRKQMEEFILGIATHEKKWSIRNLKSIRKLQERPPKKFDSDAVVLRGKWGFTQFSDEYYWFMKCLKSHQILSRNATVHAFPPRRSDSHPNTHFCFVVTEAKGLKYKQFSSAGEYGMIHVYLESQRGLPVMRKRQPSTKKCRVVKARTLTRARKRQQQQARANKPQLGKGGNTQRSSA